MYRKFHIKYLLLFIIQRIYNSVPCRYPCRQCRTQQIDDHTENKCQQEYPRTKQRLHVQAELARRTHILIIGEQPRTHDIHCQIAEHQPHCSTNQGQYEVLIQYLPYQYAARRSECLTYAQLADALLHTTVAQAAQVERRY